MSRFQDKLNNYEVIPPAEVWDRIAIDLDDLADTDGIGRRLHEMEVAPPPVAWNNIADALISGTDTDNYVVRLQNMEVVPPPAAWNQIQTELYQSAETPVVSIKKRRPAFIRYAAAAALIAAVSLSVVKWTGSREKGAIVQIENANPVTPPKPNNPATNESIITPDKQAATTDLASVASPASPASAQPPIASNYNRVKQPVKRTRASTASTTAADYSDQYTNPIYAYQDYVPNLADRYIMLMTPDGNFIRMSKKLGNLVCCVSGEEQDADCKSKLKQWQEKLATSPFATSPGNFLDVLNLVGSLDDPGTEL
jgi:hypothetical protein